MWTRPSELDHAWRQAYIETLEAGRILLLHFENIHFGGEFLPLQQALLHGHVAQFPAANCVLSIGGEATTWLLAQLAANSFPFHESNWETRNHSLHWLGATAGMQVCTINALASQAVVNGMGQGIFGDSHHVQRALARNMSLDRAIALPRYFTPVVTRHPSPETTDSTVSRSEGPKAETGAIISWIGFLTALVMFLFGFTQFVLRFL